MLVDFYKTAWRSLLRHKIFSILNISGLAIGMAACFFIFQYIYFERSYEKYNPNADNVYRIPLEFRESSGNSYTQVTNYAAIGSALKNNFPEVVSYARLIPENAMLGTITISRMERGVIEFSSNEKKVFSADAPILRMLSVQLIYGNDSTALTEISTIVISASAAKKYFGNKNPMGKTLYLNNVLPLTVSGVFKDIPENTHLKFDMLISFPDDKFHSDTWSWDEFYTYIMLSPGTSPDILQDKFPAFMERYLGSKMKQGNFRNKISLQPIKDIHLTSQYRRELEPGGNENDTWLLSILSLFVLLIAYINFINLSAAKVMERADEVGIRKVIGASKSQLVCQFLVESFVFNCIAFIAAVIIIFCLTPFYDGLIGKNIKDWIWASGLLGKGKFWLILSSLLIGGSVMVGIYPALLMSKYNPIYVLKGKFYGSRAGVMVRKILSVVQFIFSMILIAGSLIIVKQLAFMGNQDLGYTKDQVLVVKTPGVYGLMEYPKIKNFQKLLKENTSVKQVGLSTEVPGEPISRNDPAGVSGESLNRNMSVSMAEIDHYFFDAYRIPILAGRNFEESDSADVSPIDGVSFPDKIPIIANESAVKALGFKKNENAVNKLITFRLDDHELKGEIIGVVTDYHQTSLKDPYQPALYIFPSRAEWKYLSINLSTNHLPETISLIENSYKKLFAGNPFDYFFQNDYFNEQYKSERRFANIFNVFTILSVFVSCLGLLGLLSFIVRIRNREIGIRRLLGATVYSLIVLFFKDFFKLITIAALIALPFIYFAGNKWLGNFAFHASLNIFIFIMPPLVLIVITFAIVALQSLKSALSNPVSSLKD